MNCSSIIVLCCVYSGSSPSSFKRSLESVVSQTGVSGTILVVLDGPVSVEIDDLVLYYQEYGFTSLDRASVWKFDYVRSPCNMGLGSAINTGIDHILKDERYSSYEYLARMDTDDTCDRRRLSQQVLFFESEPTLDILGTAAAYELADGNRIIIKMPSNTESICKSMFYFDPFVHPTVMFRLRIFRANFRYICHTPRMEDTLTWQSARIRGLRMANLSEVLYTYNLDVNVLKRRGEFGERFDLLKIRLSFASDSNHPTLCRLSAITRFFIMSLPVPFIRFFYRIRR